MIALDHLKKCLLNARRFHAALDRPAKAPPGIRLVLYAGDAEETAVAALAHPRKVKLTTRGPGDGTVARYSAVMDERFPSGSSEERLRSPIDWHDVNFLFRDHLGLTKDKTFSDNILFLLLER